MWNILSDIIIVFEAQCSEIVTFLVTCHNSFLETTRRVHAWCALLELTLHRSDTRWTRSIGQPPGRKPPISGFHGKPFTLWAKLNSPRAFVQLLLSWMHGSYYHLLQRIRALMVYKMIAILRCLQLTPDRSFHKFGASKSVVRRSGTT